MSDTVDKMLTKTIESELSQIQSKISNIIEILPKLNKISDEVFVIKLDESFIFDLKILDRIVKEITLLVKFNIEVIIVHDYSTKIQQMIETLGIQSFFSNDIKKIQSKIEDGFIDDICIKMIEMLTKGSINSHIVNLINANNIKAIGLSGQDMNIVKVKKSYKPSSDENIDFLYTRGFVGEPVSVNSEIIYEIRSAEIIPVISPVCTDDSGQQYLVNGTELATFIAKKVGAHKLIIISNNSDSLEKSLFPQEIISLSDAKENFTGPKSPFSGSQILQQDIEHIVDAVSSGVVSGHIINANNDYSMLLEIFNYKNNKNISICKD